MPPFLVDPLQYSDSAIEADSIASIQKGLDCGINWIWHSVCFPTFDSVPVSGLVQGSFAGLAP
jgi:hypothetical protein